MEIWGKSAGDLVEPKDVHLNSPDPQMTNTNNQDNKLPSFSSKILASPREARTIDCTLIGHRFWTHKSRQKLKQVISIILMGYSLEWCERVRNTSAEASGLPSTGQWERKLRKSKLICSLKYGRERAFVWNARREMKSKSSGMKNVAFNWNLWRCNYVCRLVYCPLRGAEPPPKHMTLLLLMYVALFLRPSPIKSQPSVGSSPAAALRQLNGSNTQSSGSETHRRDVC